jgi:putative ABC transport system ATP-binding protein
MSQAVLEVEGLSKTYEDSKHSVRALKNVSFSLNRAEFVVVMGTSGSGKSTLLHILSALDKPTSGTIKLNGQPCNNIFHEPEAAQYRLKNIGFVFQAYNLLKDLTAEDNIAVPLILQGEHEALIQSRVEDVLQLLGLFQWRRHRPVELSGGQQQRVAIGRAIIANPPILLADEPTGNLDYNTSKDIVDVFVRMRDEREQSILLVTHDPVVATSADRVLFFHDGEIWDEYICKGKQDLDNILRIFKSITEGR